DEQEFKLYLFGPYSASQPGNFVYDKDPVVLAVTEEGLVNYYDMSVRTGGGVGYFNVQPDGQLYGGMVLDVKAVKCNSRYSLVETDAEDIQVYVKGGQVVERDTTDPNVFHVKGFAGYGNASFTVNPAKRTVVSAPNQCEVILKMQDGSMVPFYATCNIWVEGEPIPEYVIRGSVEPVDDDSAVVYLQNWFIADWNYGFYVAFMETEMTLPFNPLKTDGVESVSVDSADDAPAEYYSLQGVRMMNPEAGQLVIKRQGSEVRKVVIR
ncbi:MAG: hypothetical protein K2K36_04700, partial [Muribaculaceae bacterium]|nr:hypothetical protein [Muribaculaceae bacterium]